MTFNPSDHLIPIRKNGPPDYLPVAWRLVWLRDQHPAALIETQHIELDLERNHAIFRATVTIPDGGTATGYGSETARDFGDFIEKAETKAIGRALAALGFGTQFTGDEMAEGERIVDSPVQRSAPRSQPTPARTVNEAAGGGTIAPGVGMTDNQRKAIWAIAKNELNWTDADVEQESMKAFGVELKALDKQQASELIGSLKKMAGDELVATAHPQVQQAMDHREADWMAKMGEANSMVELSRIGRQIAEANVTSDELRAAYRKHTDRLQEKALV
jgi:hypothetical protein